MPNFYSISKIRAENGGTAGRIDIYGEIEATKFWGDEITPSGFIADLSALGPVNEIECHIFSPGGDMFAAMAIYSTLRYRSETVNIYIDGIAASAATLIACAGDNVYMPPEAMMYVHLPLSCPGYVNEHGAEEFAADLLKMKEPMISAYMAKTGRTREEVIAAMDGKTGNGGWLTAAEAIEFGIADAYTPEEKKPLEVAANIAPGIFNFKGHKVDLTKFDKAAEMTAHIINNSKGGMTPMGLFNRKTKPAAKTRAEIVFVEMVCPACGGAVNLNPETGEIYPGTGQNAQPGNGGATAPAASLARRMPGNVQAAIFSVVCPHCGEGFTWDTDSNTDGGDGEPLTPAVPLEGGDTKPAQAPAQAPTPAPAQAPAARLPAGPKAELAQSVCPNCGANLTYDTTTAGTGVDEAGTEGYLLTCSECNTQYIEPFPAVAPGAIPVGTTSAQAAYRAGVLAERNRQLALDEMLLAVPDMGTMIQAAKRTGASAETMSRNVIKAMAQGKGGGTRARQFSAALDRDIQASGVNTMRTPQHAAAPKSVEDSAYLKRIEDWNKARGGRDDG